MTPKLLPPGGSVARLAEKRLRTHELASQMHERAAPSTAQMLQPFICISRMVGSGGTELAHELGRRLGWAVYDREILHAMAGDDDTRVQIYASLDERDPGWTEDTLRALMEPGFVRNDYFRRLQTTVWSIARSQPALFVGRGADLILPRSQGLRIRIVAPREQCLRHFAERHQLPYEQACLEVDRIENERAQFIRSNFQQDPELATRYDLILNLGTFSQAQAVEIVMTALRMRHLI